MEHNQYDLLEVLDHIEPAELDYQQWVNVGMALEIEGYGVDVWDAWSRRDPGRYHPGECRKKWAGFHGSGSPVRFFRNYPYHSPFAYISFAAKSALLHLPYIVRFTIFNLLFVPSTKPFESSLATEFSTASISFSNPFANRDISFKSEFLYRSINKYNRGILFFSYISRNSRTQCINSLSLGYFCKIYALWFSLSSTPIQR